MKVKAENETSGGFLQAAEGAAALQTGCTFLETRVYSGSFLLLLSLTGCNLFPSSPSSLPPTASPLLLVKKGQKKLACISALCLEFPNPVKPWQRAFPLAH